MGALRVPVSGLPPFLMPSEVVRGLSVNAFWASWQVAQATWPVELKRLSSKSFFPSAIFSGVCGLSAGMGTGGRPSGGAVASAAMAAAPTRAAAATNPSRMRFMSCPHCVRHSRQVPRSWTWRSDTTNPSRRVSGTGTESRCLSEKSITRSHAVQIR